MDKNTIILITTVFIFLIIGMAYFLFPATQHEDKLKEKTQEGDTIGECGEEMNKSLYGGDFRVNIIEEELNINSKLPFKVGDEFEYHTISSSLDAYTLFIVEEINKIKGKEYYAIRTKGWGKQKLGGRWYEIPKGEGAVWLYYDKNTGEAFENGSNGYELRKLGSHPQIGLPLYYWMLALNDNFKWVRWLNTTGLGYHIESKIVYEVIGREKVKERWCFKVEKKIIDLKTNKTMPKKSIYWVDVETRILIKEVEYENNIKIYENNLLSAPFLK